MAKKARKKTKNIQIGVNYIRSSGIFEDKKKVYSFSNKSIIQIQREIKERRNQIDIDTNDVSDGLSLKKTKKIKEVRLARKTAKPKKKKKRAKIDALNKAYRCGGFSGK